MRIVRRKVGPDATALRVAESDTSCDDVRRRRRRRSGRGVRVTTDVGHSEYSVLNWHWCRRSRNCRRSGRVRRVGPHERADSPQAHPAETAAGRRRWWSAIIRMLKPVMNLTADVEVRTDVRAHDAGRRIHVDRGDAHEGLGDLWIRAQRRLNLNAVECNRLTRRRHEAHGELVWQQCDRIVRHAVRAHEIEPDR